MKKSELIKIIKETVGELKEQGPRPSQINKAEAQRAYEHLLNNDYGIPKVWWQYAIWGLLLLLEGDGTKDPDYDAEAGDEDVVDMPVYNTSTLAPKRRGAMMENRKNKKTKSIRRFFK